MDPWIVARQVTVRRADIAPDRPRPNLHRDLCTKRVASVLIEHAERDPVAPLLHDVVQQKGRSVAVDHHDVDSTVIVDVTKHSRAARRDERRDRTAAGAHLLESWP